MRLLIITQKVDYRDPVLGFFHQWIEEFSKDAERVTVICLEQGQFELPSNVTVLSLGKETNQSRVKYIGKLWRYLWHERANYDTVFVHMNQEYLLLAGWWWKLTGKKIWFWRNHPYGNFLTSVAVGLANRVFCTSPQAFTAQFKKTEIMPVGIDTDTYHPDSAQDKIPRSILALGRVSPVKRLEILIEALDILKERGVSFVATVVGSPASKQDFSYEQKIHLLAESLAKSGHLTFKPAVTPLAAPALYQKNEVYVNMTPTGSMDKTIFEAMACQIMVATSNLAVTGLVPDTCIFAEGDAQDLARTLEQLLTLSTTEKKQLGETLGRYAVVHSLPKLIQKICAPHV